MEFEFHFRGFERRLAVCFVLSPLHSLAGERFEDSYSAYGVLRLANQLMPILAAFSTFGLCQMGYAFKSYDGPASFSVQVQSISCLDYF